MTSNLLFNKIIRNKSVDCLMGSSFRLRAHKCFLVLLCVAVCLFICPRALNGEGIGEYKVKAAYIYNFAKFVEWPNGTFNDQNSPIIVGILGSDPFGQSIDVVVNGKLVGDRRLEVHRFKSLRNLKYCHILFVCQSEDIHLSRVLEAVDGWHTLTIGESEKFGRSGGLINFVNVDDKVRFDINMSSARKNGLTVSSRLLKLARVVK